MLLLYANSTIYESSDFTECVLDTTSGGTGIYASRGTVQQISWEFTEGKLTFKDETGSQLIVNRGSSFISYVKSSERPSVSIS